MGRGLAGFVLGLLVAAVLWLVERHRRQRFARRVVAEFQAIADGDAEARQDGATAPVGDATANSLHRMAAAVEEQLVQLSQERDILRHILHSMTTGVVYIASGGRVKMVNDAAERMFRRPAEQWIEREHWSVFGYYHLSAAIDRALLFGSEWRGELKLSDNFAVEARLIVMGSPPRARLTETSFDVLMLFNDVSEWRRLERMRSEFVANVSHELKTPIAAIRGFAETLLDGDVDAETTAAFLQTMYDESKRMGNLVTDLLELSKLEGAEHALDKGRVLLSAEADLAIDRLRPEAAGRHIQLCAQPMGGVTVWANEDKLLQVFLNLLGNAIHYTPDGGTVTIACDILVDRVKVHVRDTGIGIPIEHQSRVFERFYRVDRDRSRASGGTGLGLAIVKHIISAHGGEVGVTSLPGEGSDFWFTLSRLEEVLVGVDA